MDFCPGSCLRTVLTCPLTILINAGKSVMQICTSASRVMLYGFVGSFVLVFVSEGGLLPDRLQSLNGVRSAILDRQVQRVRCNRHEGCGTMKNARFAVDFWWDQSKAVTLL